MRRRRKLDSTLNSKQNGRRLAGCVSSSSGRCKVFIDGPESGLAAPNIDVRYANSPLVLHVDDDADLVNAVSARFGAAGYRVASALDGRSGIEAAQMNPASAIVLDYDMPNGRGDTVIKSLRSQSSTRDIPIVVLTAVHEKGLDRRLLNQGADRFMTKPFEFSELQETVATLIDSRS
jgi:CheY-like chemotaxis protein